MSSTTVTKYPTATAGAEWTDWNAAHIGTDDADYASVQLLVAHTVYSGDAYHYDFAVPAGATIVSLKVEGEWYESNGAANAIITFRPMTQVGGGPGTWRGAQASGYDSTTPTIVSATATTNLPIIAEINADAFNVRVSAKTDSSIYSYYAYLDFVRLTVVYYTPATATTAAISAITQETATGGGNATSAGSGTISEKGVCWNSSGSPTIADPHTSDGSGTGAFGSSLTGLFASSRYYVRAYATTEDGTSYGAEVQFDTLASASRSLVARPFTTRAAAAELVARQSDAIVDWWFDWTDEADRVRAELRPTDVATIPRNRWYVISRDMPDVTVSVVRGSEDTPDIICVVFRAYGITNVRDGTWQRVYYPAAPTSLIQRAEPITLDSYMNTSDAVMYAQNTWLRVSADAMAIKATALGGLPTVDGQLRPAPLILAGDWIDPVDEPGHVPTYITGTTFSRATGVVTITTGGREQSELIIPGMSALPQALTVYGADAGYSSEPYVEPYIAPSGDGGMTPPPPPPLPPLLPGPVTPYVWNPGRDWDI